MEGGCVLSVVTCICEDEPEGSRVVVSVGVLVRVPLRTRVVGTRYTRSPRIGRFGDSVSGDEDWEVSDESMCSMETGTGMAMQHSLFLRTGLDGKGEFCSDSEGGSDVILTLVVVAEMELELKLDECDRRERRLIYAEYVATGVL
jgi:hypothetical protein